MESVEKEDIAVHRNKIIPENAGSVVTSQKETGVNGIDSDSNEKLEESKTGAVEEAIEDKVDVTAADQSSSVSDTNNNDSNGSITTNDTTKTDENHDEKPSRPFIGPVCLPPNILGKDPNNAVEHVIGTRGTQKPRLGVKYPCRNLTSQIVTQDEIAQEIFERSVRKYTEPEKGDMFFTMKLTHRLANKINSKNDGSVVEETATSSKEVIVEKKSVDKLSEAKSDVKSFLSSTAGPSSSIDESQNSTNGKFIKLEEMDGPASDYNTKSSIGDVPSNEKQMDNETLLAILEGTAELSDVMSTSSSNEKSRGRRKRTELDPDVERELALKQLADFESTRKRRKRSEIKGLPVEEAKSLQDKASTSVEIIEPANQGTMDATEPKKKGLPVQNGKSPVKRKAKSKVDPVPKRLSKKYQRIVKKQIRNSKLKLKNQVTTSPEGQKKLPEVPEVKMAIDRYVRTYTNKRKQKPSEMPGTSRDSVASSPVEKEDKEVKSDQVASGAEHEGEGGVTSVVTTEEKTNNVKEKPKANSKVMREINRLLGDEGAINMIYALEQKRTPGGQNQLPVSSLRRKKKDLVLKTKLVKNAVLRQSMSSGSTDRVGRSKPADGEKVEKPTKSSRKLSVESVESVHSDGGKSRKFPAEASKIIRRHSSSSSGSSSEDDAKITPVSKSDTQKRASVVTPTTSARKQSSDPQKSAKKATEPSSSAAVRPTPSKPTVTPNVARATTSRASMDDDSRNVPVPAPRNITVMSVPENEPVTLPVEKVGVIQEINMQRYGNLIHIIFTPVSTRARCTFGIKMLQELTSVLSYLAEDLTCTAVLVTSACSSFCQGIDLCSLIRPTLEERMAVVKNFAKILTNFVKQLADFKKPIIAGVNGAAVGLGVTMLPFFDMVFATEVATFYTPYAKLGQVPEAAATLTLPRLIGTVVTNELLFGCRILTATECFQYGLVTRVLWPERFSEELLANGRLISTFSPQSIQTTKYLLRKELRSKLESALELECKFLVEHWCSEECQANFRKYLSEEMLLGEVIQFV